MAFGLKKKDNNAMVPPAADDANEISAPAPVLRAQRSNGGSLGIGGICLIVAAVVLLAAIGSQFFAMKAMFVF
ncbi:MAG: hypothetical protein IKR13_02650 [Victivallales bacterium]|nr:hypothetical protein [Victivallales bacterium]